MENIVPALLTLHLFGIILWTGGTVTQYVFLGNLGGENGNTDLLIDLTRKTYHYMIWPGIAMIVVSGLTIILLFGMEWLRPRGFIHFKITIAVLLIFIAHLGWLKYKMIHRLTGRDEPESDDAIRIDKAHRTWKVFLIIHLIGLGSVIILGVYKFGF